MDYVHKTATEIRTKIINKENIEGQYTDFEEKYPKLYLMLQKKDIDEEMFNKLFELLCINTSESNASKFSEFGAEKYLYPKFGRPSKNDKDIASKKIEKMLKK